LLYYQQSRMIREQLRDTFGLAINYALIGLVFDQRKQYDTALHYYLRSLDLKRKNQDMLGTALTLNDMSKVYATTHQTEQAMRSAHEALHIASSIQALGAARGAAEQLVQLYRTKGNYQIALHLYDTVIHYSNLLITANKDKEYARMEALLKLENAEEENTHLRTEQKLKEVELRNTRILSGVAVIGIILAILIALGVMSAARRMRVANERLQQQQDVLVEQEATIRENNHRLSENNTLLGMALREKDELIGIVAHDLKNPLTGIALSLEILERASTANKLTNESVQKNVGGAMKSIERMQHLIRALLSDHAVQSGAIVPAFDNVDISEVLIRVLHEYEPRADKKGITLSLRSLKPDDKTPRTDQTSLLTRIVWYTDARIFHDIIDNLVSNAVKYSRFNSMVRIDCTCNDILSIAVVDEGEGIAPEEQEHLFKRFSRLSTKPTGGEDSTGLGLSIVKRYVEIIGGTIAVESVQGQGSVFRLQLPSMQL
jgi:signal transduction histidine kinase